ncbi:29400_t:CDS:2, partial [Gigaspora margarita]
DPLFFPVDESDRLANFTRSKKRYIEDSTLTELLEEEKFWMKVLNYPEVQLDNTDYIDSGDEVGEGGIFLEAVEDPSWKLDIGTLEDNNYYRIEELLIEYDKFFVWTF